MQAEAAGRALDCNACHAAHAFDTREAAAEACTQCHADRHSESYAASPHAALWRAELAGEAPPGTGVSCATCHLPRVADEGGRVVVRHDQNDFLRPNEKLVRPVCMRCHGPGFSLDALADAELVARSFRGAPARRVESIRFASELRFELEGKPPPAEAQEESR
jgi:hypothetical protein